MPSEEILNQQYIYILFDGSRGLAGVKFLVSRRLPILIDQQGKVMVKIWG
jgi:hypothetical protein